LDVSKSLSKTFYSNFYLLLFAKMRRYNVPPNYKVLECCQLLDTCFTMVDCNVARGSWVPTNFCIFPSLVISLNFNIWNKQFQKKFKISKDHLITAKPEKVVLVLWELSVELDGYRSWQWPIKTH
jgi:hypothetical protein